MYIRDNIQFNVSDDLSTHACWIL